MKKTDEKVLKFLFENFETNCRCEITLWKLTMKYEKSEEVGYVVQKKLIGNHNFIVYDFRFNYLNKKSALNKIDKLYEDLKKDNFELVESQLQK